MFGGRRLTDASQFGGATEALCAQEPIHIPGSIQPHGLLFVVREPEFTIEQFSANARTTPGIDVNALQGGTIGSALGPAGTSLYGALQGVLGRIEANAEYILTVELAGTPYHAIAHRRDGLLILELERSTSKDQIRFSHVYTQITRFMTDPERGSGVQAATAFAAKEIRRITGFDRVLVYRFDVDWNGVVIAEDRNEELPSYLDLHFPASDIPPQARELYRLNRIRIIPDSEYIPIPVEPALNPRTGKPIDLSFSVLRSVSPIHVQYMKNMGTAASMSISVLRDGLLWGLISCHHHVPRMVPIEIRSACDIVSQILSSQLAAADHRADAEVRITLKSNQTKLLGYMAEEANFLEGVRNHPDELLAAANADSAAIIFGGECLLFGNTPNGDDVRALANWLQEVHKTEDIFATDSLPTFYPQALSFAGAGSGLLAASLSALHGNYVLWFRSEWQRTVKWGGDPRKQASGDGALSPRHSFEMWKETVRGRSRPWTESERNSALDLRNALVRIVFRKAEEMAQLTDELRRSNQELEAFSYSVSHDLRAPFRHIVGFAELLAEREAPTLSETAKRYIRTIVESAQFAGTLVDNLLSFSQIGRKSLHFSSIDTNKLVAEAKVSAEADPQDPSVSPRRVVWQISEFPLISGDVFMLRLVFQNLISNALKYTRDRNPAKIEIGTQYEDGQIVFFVRDNGVGFDSQYAGKLFGVFQRLHKMEDFEGTGIGLANVRRIVTRHGGRTWAEGTPNQGATFYFSLPANPEYSPKLNERSS